MKLLIPCNQCFQDSLTKMPGSPLNVLSAMHIREVRDDSRYEVVCSHGHTSLAVLQEQKYEVLCEIGAHAILDGYYRESVASFASGMERFFEFSIRVLSRASGVDGPVVQTCWKKVSSQSERQLGAFIFLWAARFRQVPILLGGKSVELRNDVIHKGRIPTRAEAIRYGNEVVNTIRENLRLLKDSCPEEIQDEVFAHLRNGRGPAKGAVGTVKVLTLVSLTASQSDEKDLESYLESLRERRAFEALIAR